jgi:hypothetical protein
MVSCGIQSFLWALISILLTIFLVLVIVYFYIIGLEDEFISEYNSEFNQFCQTLPPIQYTHSIYIPNENGVYERKLALALLDIAFAVSDANCNNILPIPSPPNLPNQLRIEGIDPISGDLLMFAYIFSSRVNCTAVIAFTGTEFISEWISDIDYFQTAPTVLNGYEPGVLVHEGFYNIYLSIRNQLWNWWKDNSNWLKTLYITGHSLGGALSTICAYDFADIFEDGCNSRTGPPEIFNFPIHYSFAAPRSGNPKYAEIFNRRVPTSLRINNTEDAVPALPPATFNNVTYEQTTGNVPFTKSLGSLSKNHSEAYKKYMPLCPDVAKCYY